MQNHGHGLAHSPDVKLLVGVWVALMILTVMTVGAVMVDLGSINIVIAMGIATIKALLVAGFFMHLRWDNRFNSVALFVCLVMLGYLLTIALLDTHEYQPDIQAYSEAAAAAAPK